MKYLIILIPFCFAISCTEKEVPKPSKQVEKKVSFNYNITYNDSLGWGYELIKENKVFIKQETIPAIQGNKGFKTKEDAENVAEFALEKLKNNQGFPSITKKELIELRVIEN